MEKFSISAAIASIFSSTSGQGGGSTTTGTTTTNTTTRDVVQRHLAYPDELMVMRDGKQLVLIENYNPIRAKRLSWLDDEKRRALGVNLRQPAPVELPTAPVPLSPPAPAPVFGRWRVFEAAAVNRPVVYVDAVRRAEFGAWRWFRV
jgi:type IV secretory pathway TraG/TraD family ATPase VirD4